MKTLWMRFAYVLGWLNTMLLLSVVYIFFIGPFSVISRIFGYDPLHKRINNKHSSYWQNRNSIEERLERFRYQF